MNQNYVGRALDNRMGGFVIAEVARLLKENKENYRLDYTLQMPFKRKLVYGEHK